MARWLVKEIKGVNSDSKISVLLLHSRGAAMREKILNTLLSGPKNCNQIARNLESDWWTIKKHLQFLMSAKLVKPVDFGRITFYEITLEGNAALKYVLSKKDDKLR
jgi:predicted transcriptional regulator